LSQQGFAYSRCKEGRNAKQRFRTVSLLVGFVLLAGLFLSLPTAAWAQASAGDIAGTVIDSSRAVLPEVRIDARHLATNQTFSRKVTQAGNFLLSAIPIGDYRVLAQQTGFKEYVTETSVFTAG
jgi:hypothetical protein